MRVVSTVGAEIASQATIAVTDDIHKVSGEATITTIEPPSPDFVGQVCLVGAAGASAGLSAGEGNIGASAAIDQHVATVLIFDGSTWWPVRGF